jgi:transcription elongation factor GreA
MAEQPVPLTAEGRQKLEAELADLTSRRGDIAEMLRDAQAQGSSQFDAEYDDAKQEQAMVEGRIRDIESLLSRAVMINEEQARHASRVEVGSRVEVEQDGTVRQFQIVGSPEADAARGKISNESPIGRALLGKAVGETVEVHVPRGIVQLSIRKID